MYEQIGKFNQAKTRILTEKLAGKYNASKLVALILSK